MGHFGFSYVGLIYMLMLTVPNLIWAKKKPEGYSPTGENKILLMFERIGQVLVTCIVLIFSDFNIDLSLRFWNIWLVISFLLMLLYEICWIRYFKNATINNFYSSFLIIPVPLATLPISAFFLLGIYGKVIWLLIAVIILGIGHIGIHIKHFKDIDLK